MRPILRLLLLFFLATSTAFAQNGGIKGVVTDESKMPLIGVNVVIKGTNIGSSTDFDGKYNIGNVKPGSYTLYVSYISFKPKELQVQIVAGQIANLNITLQEDVAELAAVEIQAERITYTEAAVLMEVKQATQVVSGVSSQEISRSPDKDAAQVASRVPGVTIVDNSFVMIRGLGQRYNNVMLNGISTPSTEPDSRAFSFDLIPSSVMDRMLIYKSGSADMPGDFAGGVIKLYTKTAPEYDITEVNVGLGYRHATTFNTYQVNRAGKTDFLGFDRGRSLPSDFPTNLNNLTNASQLETAGKTLSNNFQVNDEFTMPDFKMGVTIGRNFKMFGKKASNLTSVNYGQSQQHLEVERNRWTADRELMFDYTDQQIETEVRVGIISNFSIIANSRNRYTWRNTFNQIGERSTIIRRGIEPQQRLGDEYLNYSFQYLSRTIATSQFEGEHYSADKRSKFVWIAGGSYVTRNEPDFRRVRSTKPIDDPEAPYTIIDPPGAALFDNARFFSRLYEFGGSNSLAFERKLGNPEKKETITLKAGTYFDYKYRTFEARWMSYSYPGFGDPTEKTRLVRLPIGEVFDPANVNSVNGWRLIEGTNPSDRYDANTTLAAAYAAADIPMGRFNLSTGFRFEYFNQQLNSATQTEALNINNNYPTPMPFANLSYTVNDKMLVRLAYSRTVNRPELRELAPFLYYNFKYDVNFVGEPNLIQSDIQNIDLRWEMYPQNNETFSVGVFYKRFQNPIETYVQSVGLSQQFKLDNAVSAENFGAEVEVRKSLGDVSSKSFISRFFLVANASYIYTQVDLGGEGELAQEQIRPLQGQSPYVVNAGLHYRDDDRGNSFSVLYNVAGPRIFFVGNDNFPTVYELPRHMLDLVMTKKLNARMDVKFGISNILNARTLLVQDTDRNGKIEFDYNAASPDDQIMHFRRGVMWSGSFVFRL